MTKPLYQPLLGYRLLTGDDAMQVLRFRDGANGYKDGDLGRIKTQQAFLTAMVEQLLKIENIAKINAFAEVFRENVETDLTLQNILWFAKAAFTGGLKPENVEFVTMPNTPAYAYSSTTSKLNGRYSEQSYVTPNTGQLLELVNTKLSPYAEVFTRSDLDMMTVNSDGSTALHRSCGRQQRHPSPVLLAGPVDAPGAGGGDAPGGGKRHRDRP